MIERRRHNRNPVAKAVRTPLRPRLRASPVCNLVRTAPLEGAQPSRRSHNYDIEPLRRQRIWAIAVKLSQTGNTDQRSRRH